MTICFTSSIISRLKREIADIQKYDKTKLAKVSTKIKQLQKDCKLSSSASDLSSKMSQLTKLKDEASKLETAQIVLTKQLSAKNAELRQQNAKSNKPADE